VFQVTEAAVNQSARQRTRTRAKIVLLDQDGLESAHGRVAGDTCSRYSAPNHQHINGPGGETREAGPSCR